MNKTFHLGLVTAVALAACGSPKPASPATATVGYKPVAAHIDAPAPTVFSAVVASAREHGWQVAVANGALGWVEAIEPAVRSDGVWTRRQWLFRIGAGRLTVRMVFSILEEGRWTSRDDVCATYAYRRERAKLVELERRIEWSASRVARVEVTQ